MHGVLGMWCVGFSTLLTAACGSGWSAETDCAGSDDNLPTCAQGGMSGGSTPNLLADRLKWNQPCVGGMYCARPRTTVSVRVGPSRRYEAVATTDPTQVYWICQVLGENVGGNAVWDYVGVDLNRGVGLFVADHEMDTPSFGTTLVAPCP